MAAEKVLYELDDAGVATVTLNDPDTRNALSGEMLAGLTAAFERAREEPAVRCVVLASSHERTFSSGANLGGFAGEQSLVEKHFGSELFVGLFKLIGELGKPTICATRGHTLAGALGIALACDLIVASDDASFGTPEINVGLWPMMIMAVIRRNLTRKRAMELYMTGDRIDAATALQWGLVNRVVPLAEVRDAARELARKLTTKSPLIMRLGRDAFFAIDSLDTRAALEHLHAQLTVVSLSEDSREGVLAFLEKRAPDFRGR